MCSQHVSSRASMGEFTYGTLVERLQAHLDGSSSAACQPWRAWNISSGRNRLFQQETCLCVKKRPDRRTVPQSSRILLVKIYIWTVYLTGHSTTDFVRHFSYEWLFWQMQRCLNLCSILWLRAKTRFLRFTCKCQSSTTKKPAEANACYGKKVMLLGKLPPWRWRLLLT